jgi:hypothetical protein
MKDRLCKISFNKKYQEILHFDNFISMEFVQKLLVWIIEESTILNWINIKSIDLEILAKIFQFTLSYYLD